VEENTIAHYHGSGGIPGGSGSGVIFDSIGTLTTSLILKAQHARTAVNTVANDNRHFTGNNSTMFPCVSGDLFLLMANATVTFSATPPLGAIRETIHTITGFVTGSPQSGDLRTTGGPGSGALFTTNYSNYEFFQDPVVDQGYHLGALAMFRSSTAVGSIAMVYFNQFMSSAHGSCVSGAMNLNIIRLRV